MTFWTFKHKPGTNSSEIEAIEFVERAIKLNSALMQYEYNYQDNVTLQWNRVPYEINEGDILFLRGKDKIYALGQVIKPRRNPDIILNVKEIIDKKNHGEFISGKYSGCIHFNDSQVFYEDLTSGIKGDWGQRIDVLSWKYYFPEGIYAKDQIFYEDGSNEFVVIKKLKENSGLFFYNQLKNRFMGNEIELLETNKNLILTGAPGTGKTYLAKQIALKMLFGKDNEDLLSENEMEDFKIRFCFVQFHPSYDYTDFVEGLRPHKNSTDKELSFKRKNGIFMEFCTKALKALNEDSGKNNDDKRKFVFVIDEINRGEISKIFGELFFSIDPSYRGKKGIVHTQYSNMNDDEEFKEGFFVPDNIYIIGTMNDIDRSVESFDFAMRRRFAWKELTAKESQRMFDFEEAWKDGNGEIIPIKDNGNIPVDKLKNRMDNLNKAIVDKYDFSKSTEIEFKDIKLGLTSAYQIGGAYFLKLGLYVNEEAPFDCLWNNHLKGLLNEYLRGTPNADDKLKALEVAYNDIT
jgi:hypothetical protein